MNQELTVILGNQLFAPEHYKRIAKGSIFMAEDHELCTHFKYHKHKIMLFLVAMRRYRDELIDKGFKVHYRELPNKKTESSSYMEALSSFIEEQDIKTVHIFEIEDKFFETKLIELSKKHKFNLNIVETPFFLVNRSKFKDYLASVKTPFMKTFYERLRKETMILMDSSKKPVAGKYSFDSDNRNKLPKNLDPPPLIFPKPEQTPYFNEVKDIIEIHFGDHPGDCDNFWLATSRQEAKKVFRRFLDERLEGFGTYQDAITSRSDFVYHSVISPYINMGLLLPQEVIAAVEKRYHANKAPINSCEGFIRQVLGWREFIRGIYQEFDEVQQSTNFFNHQRSLNHNWYQGTTGIPPLDDAIKKANRTGYNHHIERLMVVSNIMLLCQISPTEVYKWFMEMFIDSSDWVMGPNVFGMGQFSDGGIFATKPYICGSNYLIKMSDYKKGPWCDVVDGLYWQFIERNINFFESNPRLGMMVRTLNKMKSERKELIYQAADRFIENGYQVN